MKRALVLAVIALAAGIMPARAATVTVEVRNNIFQPQKLAIEVGDTVVWNAIDADHTVTADDDRFDSGQLAQGGQFSWTFTEDETFSYHCEVHAGMVGIVEVGEGTPVPPPGGGPSEIRKVPLDYPSIGAALVGILPRGLVEVAPGTYEESIVITTTGVIVAGTGSPDSVIIEAGDTQPDGVFLFGDETGVANLTVRGAALNGVHARDNDSFTVTDVIVEDNGRTGILVEDAHGGWIQRVTATGHPRAGFAAMDCRACDTVLTDVTATSNWVGVDIEDATGIVVRDSMISGNGTGVELRTTWLDADSLDADAPQRGSHIYGNVITGNTAAPPGPPLSPNMPLRTGVGVFVGAGSHNVIESNTISGHLYGVAITALIGPTFRNTVIGNEVSDSSAADLAWDGIGLDTCFAGNTVTTVEPLVLETIYDCALPYTVGVPYPLIDLTILDHATI